ncbi:MAG: flagellar hook-length control protein FliK [Betaproteobacteria bacterium]|nr:flagellar hook-length control protein FliK [Betaproteobacteria bacterium]
MTTITPISALVSAMPGGGDMSATDTALLGKGGSFFGLLAMLLNTTAPDADIAPELPADFLADLLPQADLTAEIPLPAEFTAAAGIQIPAGHEDAHLSSVLARLLAKEKKDEGDDDEADSIIAVPFSPVQIANAAQVYPAAPEIAEAGKGAALPASGQKADAEDNSLLAKQGAKDLPLAANLAGKSDEHSSGAKEEKHDFTHLLRETAALAKAANNNNIPRATASIPAPVASSAWGERLGEQIIWMTRNGHQQVDFRLHPANLGQLSISLNLQGDKASIQFTVATMEVRQAIEEAMPRLREMMAVAGVSLGRADVDDQTRREEAYNMAKEHGAGERNPAHGEFAENAEESADTVEEHDGNMERASILTDAGHRMLFAHANGRIGGIDLFA